jgi:hypothetical protein
VSRKKTNGQIKVSSKPTSKSKSRSKRSKTRTKSNSQKSLNSFSVFMQKSPTKSQILKKRQGQSRSKSRSTSRRKPPKMLNLKIEQYEPVKNCADHLINLENIDPNLFSRNTSNRYGILKNTIPSNRNHPLLDVDGQTTLPLGFNNLRSSRENTRL